MTAQKRKMEHLEICLRENVEAEHNYWDDILFEHNALPEIDYDEISTQTEFLGKKLEMPLIINAITGGIPEAEKYNERLAKAAEKFGIGMGVGSQRPAFEGADATSYEIVKNHKIPLKIANLGAPQLVPQKKGSHVFTVEDGKKAIEMIDGDVLAIHLNFLQEVVQKEGDKNARGCLTRIKEFASAMPVIVKETGAGISRRNAEKLKTAGVKAVDISGVSGTSFAKVEQYRAVIQKDYLHAVLGTTLGEWGIPSPVCVLKSRVKGLPLVASGGIRNGLDVARAIALGADAAGIARALLKPAHESQQKLERKLEAISEELKAVMFLLGVKNIEELKKVPCIIVGRTKEYLED
ncbi:MAG: type 2 isopentenyl-diphosphate Delta-isomerase [Thermoplasmata archaeon]|nr:type 2 isopentenyl-diphosphate Delta-isomerase [Thermoplasmata archaeon]